MLMLNLGGQTKSIMVFSEMAYGETHFICIAGREEWKVVAERLGLKAYEIRFYDERVRNPCEAALSDVSQSHRMNVDDLYDVLTECGMPVLADIL